MGIFDGLRRMFAPQQLVLNTDGGNVRILDMDSAEMFRTQPNLQAVVTFLADNIAQLPLKEYDRVGDGDRRRLTGSTAALLLERPNADMTRFELIRATSLYYYLYGRCPWLVTEEKSAPSGWEIHPIPPTWIIDYHMRNAFEVESVDVLARNGTSAINIPASELIFFRTFDPESPSGSVSPIEALKQTMQEQIEADRFRLAVWKNGGKASSYIVRPKDVMPWSPEAAAAFKRDFRAAWTGNGSDIGGVPVLEDGMEIKTIQMNSRESQWAEAKKLSREDVASVYHVNPSLIWHTDGQTYASAKDNARALYNDTLAPMLKMLEQRMNAFLLPRLGESPTAYLEFDLKEKLRGSFEEQAAVIQASVGAPWLTVNEARAMNNLPAIEGGDELVVPLNVSVGGQASPQDSGSQNVGLPNELREAEQPRTKSAPLVLKSGESGNDDMEKTIKDFFARQARSVLPKIGTRSDWFDMERWVSELAEDLNAPVTKAVKDAARAFTDQLGTGEIDMEITQNYIAKMCENRATALNSMTRKRIEQAVEADEDPKGAFEECENRAEGYAGSLAKAAAAFALTESVAQAQARGVPTVGAMKRWVVTSDNPRGSHAAMDGETVKLDEEFSNGAMWPGAFNLDLEESCNCKCEVEIIF